MAATRKLTTGAVVAGDTWVDLVDAEVDGVWLNTINRLTSVAGTSTAYTASAVPDFLVGTLVFGTVVVLVPHLTCGASPTLNIDGLGTYPLTKPDGTADGTPIVAGDMIANNGYVFEFRDTYYFLISMAEVAAGSITGSKIAADTITSAHIQSGAIGSSELGTSAVTTDAILNGSVTNTKLAVDSVGNAQMIAGAITAAEIAAGAVGTTALAAGAVTGAKIGTAQINNTHIVSNSIGSSELGPGAVTTDAILAGAVGTAAIADGSITLAKMAVDSVGNAQMVGGAITATEIASFSIITAKIADGAITNAKIADGVISSSKYAPGSVDSTAILVDAVGTSEIAPGAVTATEIAADAVTTVKILDAAITNAKIANGSVSSAKLAPGSVDSTAILADSVTSAELAANSVTTIKIADAQVNNAKLADMAAGHIKGRLAASGTGVPQDLTATQVRDLLAVDDAIDAAVADVSVRTTYVTTLAGGQLTYTANLPTDFQLVSGAILVFTMPNTCLDNPTLEIFVDTVSTGPAMPLTRAGASVPCRFGDLRAGHSYHFVVRGAPGAYVLFWQNPVFTQLELLGVHAGTPTGTSPNLEAAITSIVDPDSLIGKTISLKVPPGFVIGNSPRLSINGALSVAMLRYDGDPIRAGDLVDGGSYQFIGRGAAPTNLYLQNPVHHLIEAAVTDVFGDVDNTPDADKPLSNPQQEAISPALAKPDRPGESPWNWTSDLSGILATTALSLEGAVDSDGTVLRVSSPSTVATRSSFRVEAGRKYLVRYVVRRRGNTTDPSNDSIQLAGQPLTYAGAAIGSPVVHENLNTLTTASGRTIRSFVLSSTMGTGVTHVWPANTVYWRPFAKTFGDVPVNDIESIAWQDITDVAVVSPDLDALDARVVALESLDIGDRLDALESLAGGSEIARFKDRATAVAAAAAGTIDDNVDFLEVLAFSTTDITGEGRSRYVWAATTPAVGNYYFPDLDGGFWKLTGNDFRPEMFGAGLGAADDTTALNAAITLVNLLGKSRLTLTNTYNVTGVTLKSGVTLEGVGRLATIKSIATTSNTLITIDGINDVTLRNLTIDMLGTTGSDGIGAVAVGIKAASVSCNNITVEECRFINAKLRPYVDVTCLQSGAGYYFRNNEFIASATLIPAVAPNPQNSPGIRFLSQAPLSDIVVNRNRFRYVSVALQIRKGAGAQQHGYYHSVDFSNNVVVDALEDPNVGATPTEIMSVDRLTYVGNRITSGGRGLGMFWCRSVTISGNTIEDQSIYFTEMGACDTVVFSGNTSRNNRTFVNDTTSEGFAGSKNVTIEGNTIVGGHLGIVGLNNTTPATMISMLATNDTGYKNWLIRGNLFVDCLYTGIVTGGAGVGGHILITAPLTSNIVVEGNTCIQNNELAGIIFVNHSDGTDVLIQGNTIWRSVNISDTTYVSNVSAHAFIALPVGVATAARVAVENNRVSFTGADTRPGGSGVIGIGKSAGPAALPGLKVRRNEVVGPYNKTFLCNVTSTDMVFVDNAEETATGGITLNAAAVYKRTKRVIESTAIPTAGTHRRGDYARNSIPAVGQPKGWVCTLDGTPGTWVSEGNL